MGAKAGRNVVPRSPRLQSQPKDFSNFVRYEMKGNDAVNMAAQFADVSATGMRLISRQPTSAKVGDPLLVEFTVPGENKTIKNHARIVRRINEYVIAVHFQNLKENEKQGLQAAIARYIQAAKWAFLTRPMKRLTNWASKHQQGLWISLAGAIIFGTVAAFIFFSSDWYQGRALHSWGKPYPRQWDWDYYNNINKPSK